jgi:hypothetical protein
MYDFSHCIQYNASNENLVYNSFNNSFPTQSFDYETNVLNKNWLIIHYWYFNFEHQY